MTSIAMTQEDEQLEEIRQLLSQFPRREQWHVLCVVTFMKWRDSRKLDNSSPYKRSRLALLGMVITGAIVFYGVKLQAALSRLQHMGR